MKEIANERKLVAKRVLHGRKQTHNSAETAESLALSGRAEFPQGSFARLGITMEKTCRVVHGTCFKSYFCRLMHLTIREKQSGDPQIWSVQIWNSYVEDDKKRINVSCFCAKVRS